MKFDVFQLSRKGGRQNNEDRMGYCYTRDAVLFVLADGMGGHPEGEVAAQLALQSASAVFQQDAVPVIQDPHRFLVKALMAAHHSIIKYAADKGMLDTPRTTIVMALIQRGQVCWVHCGDSRFYLTRGSELLTRTRDHSYAEQVNTGVVPMPHVNRNVLMTCLGSYTKPIYDLGGPVSLQCNDRIMLCSDGLWSSVADNLLVSMLGKDQVKDSVPNLVEEALRVAGPKSDNVTIIAMEWLDELEDFQPTAGISTNSMSDGVFASTIQANHGLNAEDVDDLDDDAIERSIAEINEAIRRSGVAQRK
jgi:serine/threonine protein phosphatase PrpC